MRTLPSEIAKKVLDKDFAYRGESKLYFGTQVMSSSATPIHGMLPSRISRTMTG